MKTLNKNLALSVVILGVLGLPAVASASTITYTAAIEVNSAGGPLGYLTVDPNYWTPELTSNVGSALDVRFTVTGNTGSQVDLTTLNSNETGFDYLGLVEGRDSTSANIGTGNFNYLYLDNTNGTAPGATPQSVGDYFSSQSGLSKPSESAVWDVNLTTLALTAQWINTNGSSPSTVFFVQSNHLYAGGDASAFNSRYPAPVTSVTLSLDILSQTVVQTAPEPSTLLMLSIGAAGLAVLGRKRFRSSR